MPLRIRVTPDFIECVVNPRNHKVEVDSFLNSLQLLEEMWSKEFRITGTIRDYRLQNCTLADRKTFSGKKRRFLKFILTKSFIIVEWEDNIIL